MFVYRNIIVSQSSQKGCNGSVKNTKRNTNCLRHLYHLKACKNFKKIGLRHIQVRLKQIDSHFDNASDYFHTKLQLHVLDCIF